MSKLVQRLADAARSGVYRARRADEILDAARMGAVDVAEVDLRAVSGKDGLLAAFAAGLGFPDWFGGNWDALEDCLNDLSWRDGSSHVLLIDGGARVPAADAQTLRGILEDCARAWAGRGQPFFAVYLGDGSDAALPELFRPRA